MVDRPVDVVDDGDTHLQIEELTGEIVVAGRAHDLFTNDRPGSVVAHQLHAVEGGQRRRQELVGDRLVHDKGLCRVAHAGSLGLGVDDNAQGHVEVGRRVHVYVAVALTVNYIGDGR